MTKPARPIDIPGFDEIKQASLRLAPILKRVPLLESESLNRAVGGRLLIKAETLQPTGSFKVRGAWNRIQLRSHDEMTRGVLALSSGNHGRAVAWAAKSAGIGRAVILMPQQSPANKIARTRELGADVVIYDRQTVDRASLIESWRSREKLVLIPAFDDRHVIAGAGTVALETLEAAREIGADLNGLYAACSGGGLVAGSAITVRALSPETAIWGVEPAGYDDTAQSLAKGERVTIVPPHDTLCDALVSIEPGELTFQVNSSHLAGILVGDNDTARLGMKIAFEEFGLVAEPSGAIALGAVLSERAHTEGRTIAVVVSGRNVDIDLYTKELGEFAKGGA
ncbi:threonine/serine dehydratase [Agrobacterium sp. T29]|uniref:threonine ammonia-lyase n=1 Tax=Agrobacterium sp. T29 TaxID=2580515 RepID=UPI00143D7D07|nr:threonine/serine dehydratase [Agrobacterium sp. T29]